MQLAAFERSILFRFILASLCALALSGCGLAAREPGVADFDVSIPEFGSLEGPEQIQIQREKIAAIEFVAPAKGTIIFKSRTHHFRGFQKIYLNSDYLLEEDTEPLLQEAATRFFEIDPDAKTRIRLELVLKGLTYQSGAGLCSKWTSRITSTFVVTEITPDGQETSESFSETASETDCDTIIIPMPTGAAFEGPLQESLTKALQKMTKSRSGQSVASAPAS